MEYTLPKLIFGPVLKKNPLSDLVKYTLLFISNTFISNNRLKLVKNLADAKQHSQAEKRESCPNMAILRLFWDENKQHVSKK